MTPPAEGARPAGAEPPALVITGMHRSGTSLAASMLAAAGVHIGEQLMGPANGNPRGHFEDMDFVRLHERILTANGLSRDGFTCHESIVIPAMSRAEATRLRDRRRGAGRMWGWKDPRSTLFLNFWADVFPEARFLFMVRPPWEVVDSLFRRGDEVFATHPRLAVDLWVSYNRRILDFALANRQRCAVIDTGDMTADPTGFVAQVGGLLGRPLDHPRDLYEPDLLETGTAVERRTLVEATHPESARLYAALREIAAAGGAAHPPNEHCPDLAEAAITEWWRGVATARETRARETAERAAIERRLVAERDQGIAETRQQAADAAARWQAERATFEADHRDLERRLLTALAEARAARDGLERRRRSIGERILAEGRRLVRRFGGRSSRAACE